MFKIEKMDLLVSIYIFCIAVAEFLGAKTFPIIQTDWLKLNASVAIFIIPLVFSINDVIVEVYGAERARGVVRCGLIVIGLIFLYATLAVYLPPSKRFLTSEAAYDAVFSKAMRISLASLTAFAVSDFLDIYIFSKIRQRLGKAKLWLRNNLSNFIAQGIDTTLFISLAFYAVDKPLDQNVGFLVSLIIPYWLLKCSMSIIETPFVYIGVKWLKNDKK